MLIELMGKIQSGEQVESSISMPPTFNFGYRVKCHKQFGGKHVWELFLVLKTLASCISRNVVVSWHNGINLCRSSHFMLDCHVMKLSYIYYTVYGIYSVMYIVCEGPKLDA